MHLLGWVMKLEEALLQDLDMEMVGLGGGLGMVVVSASSGLPKFHLSSSASLCSLSPFWLITSGLSGLEKDVIIARGSRGIARRNGNGPNSRLSLRANAN